MNSEVALPLIKKFQDEWPIERVESMTLEEYTNLNKQDSFSYWLEFKVSNVGSIKGGNALKFGIYRRNDIVGNQIDSSSIDEKYAWYSKYGSTAEEAFNTIKDIIIKIIIHSKNNELKQIDNLDLGDAVKWKIAYLYNHNQILPIFNKTALFNVAQGLKIDNSNIQSISLLHKKIIDLKPKDVTLQDYAHDIYFEFNKGSLLKEVKKLISDGDNKELQKRGYSRKFQKLKLQVGLGMGSPAKIPWIALLGEDQRVSNGIYPVILYYKSIEKVILAYGISEETKPNLDWGKEGSKTINEWYNENYRENPFRYRF
jgi:hypothetical protein